MKDLKGLYSALLIPFDENGEVKESCCCQLHR